MDFVVDNSPSWVMMILERISEPGIFMPLIVFLAIICGLIFVVTDTGEHHCR